MKTKKFIEYDVREIAEDGYVIELLHFSRGNKAREEAKRLVAAGALAVVVERRTGFETAEGVVLHDFYETVLTLGEPIALANGGWSDPS